MWPACRPQGEWVVRSKLRIGVRWKLPSGGSRAMTALALWVGASAIAGRPIRTPRASPYMMEGASIFRQPAFLLGKPGLPVEREAVGSVLERSVATVAPLPETPVPPSALAHVSDASTTALAATSSSGGAFPLLPVVLVAIPVLLYFVVLPRLDVVVVVVVVVHRALVLGEGSNMAVLLAVRTRLGRVTFFTTSTTRLDSGPADASDGQQPRRDGAAARDNAQALAEVQALAEAEARRAEASGEVSARARVGLG